MLNEVTNKENVFEDTNFGREIFAYPYLSLNKRMVKVCSSLKSQFSVAVNRGCCITTDYYDSSHALRQQISKSAILNFPRAIACSRSGIRFLNLLNIYPRWRHLCAVTCRCSFFLLSSLATIFRANVAYSANGFLFILNFFRLSFCCCFVCFLFLCCVVVSENLFILIVLGVKVVFCMRLKYLLSNFSV